MFLSLTMVENIDARKQMRGNSQKYNLYTRAEQL